MDTDYSIALLNAAVDSIHVYAPWLTGKVHVVVHDKTAQLQRAFAALPTFAVRALTAINAQHTAATTTTVVLAGAFTL